MTLRLLILSLSLFICSSPATATTLKYVGKEFFFGNIFDGHVEATVVFSSPLTEGDVLSLMDISSFSLSTLSPLFGNRNIASADATFAFAEFTIGPKGLPTDWAFGAELNLEGNDNPEQIATASGTTTTIFGQTLVFTSDIFFIDDPKLNDPAALNPGGGGATAMDQGPGTWSVVPESGSLTLLVFYLILVLSRTRASRSGSP